MSESVSPISPDLFNVNTDTKPDTSKFNKNINISKDDVNQNRNYIKSTSPDKFKNSPLLTDKKQKNSPRSTPHRASPARSSQHRSASRNTPSPRVSPSKKIRNSPSPVKDYVKSPSPIKEEKIINSPVNVSGRSSVNQEFRLVNPTSRSASVTSPVESPSSPTKNFITHARRGSCSDNDSLGDEEILELLSDDAVHEEHTDDVFTDSVIRKSPTQTVTHPETTQGSTSESVDQTVTATDDDDFLDETIEELQIMEAEGLDDLCCDKDDDNGTIEIIQNRSSSHFDTEEALSGLLEIAEMAEDFGLSEDGIDNMSQAMSVWIEESIDNLKDMLKKTMHKPVKRRNQNQPNTPSKLPSKSCIPQKSGLMKPQSRLQAPKSNKAPVKCLGDSHISEYSDSPLSRFSQPSNFERRLVAKLTIESMKDQQHEIGTSPIPPTDDVGRRRHKPISQSESGDFTGSSRTSPSGEYGSYTSGSNYNSEPPSRSYTPSYASYTPSDASENSEDESSPDYPAATGLRKPGSYGSRGGSLGRNTGGRAARGGVRGRATGVRRLRPSYSGEQLGGLVESSSGESFVEEGTPRSLAGLRKPALSARGGSPGRGGARVNNTALARPSNLAIPSSTRSLPTKGTGLPKPSGLQRPRGGIPKPSGIARGAPKSRGSGIARPGLKKPSSSNSNWDEGCF